eukprot:119396_1
MTTNDTRLKNRKKEKEAFMKSIHEISDIVELRNKFSEFYDRKESEIYELKRKFTNISRSQKECFVELDRRLKRATSKGKKYKAIAQELHCQLQQMNNDLMLQRKQNRELNDELNQIRVQMSIPAEKQIDHVINKSTNNETKKRLQHSVDTVNMETFRFYPKWYIHEVKQELSWHDVDVPKLISRSKKKMLRDLEGIELRKEQLEKIKKERIGKGRSVH